MRIYGCHFLSLPNPVINIVLNDVESYSPADWLRLFIHTIQVKCIHLMNDA
jgi:hypothetical protein